MRVAYQGMRGAYSEEAALRHFGAPCQPVPCAFSEQVFDAVESGSADFGLLPVENSIVGPVTVNEDLFLRKPAFIIAETYLRIEHCLLGLPGSALTKLSTVYSHPVALEQCRDFLAARHLGSIPEYDTAGAAELVASRGRRQDAAIASKRCAEVYGLSVLAENIQNARENFTRFAVFVRSNRIPPGQVMEKTSIAFSAKHKPGALLDCLRRFAENGVNLLRLESRPVPEDPFQYIFLADLVGGLKDAGLAAALEALCGEAGFVKVLGSYPAAPRP
ncbi:MAG: prephenate dehydratase [Elusimicrobia bacterium]|nr:prephenate dehydratase [Elusimicrobiota bacterium]